MEETAPDTTATAAEGSAPAPPAAPAQLNADTAPTADLVGEGRGGRECWECQEAVSGVHHQDKSSAQQSANTNLTSDTVGDKSEEEDLENDERAKKEEEHLVWDKTVKNMMNMKINQRKDEGDMESFKRGSKYRLEFNIWKTERKWELQKMHEAKSSPAAADKKNNTESGKEDRKQENEANKDKDPNRDGLTRATCAQILRA